MREHLPHGLFLVPGYGHQGGAAADAVAGFVPGPDGRLEGGVVGSSRGVLFPEAGAEADTAGWERATDAALQAAMDDLRAAIEPS